MRTTRWAVVLAAVSCTWFVERAAAASWPEIPPAEICGNKTLLSGPKKPPQGAIVVPAGDNSQVDFTTAGATYWFARGTHTLGGGEFDQIMPGDNSTFIGAPMAVLDGQRTNRYAFTQRAKNVTIKYLTIRNFGKPGENVNEGAVNHDSGQGWTLQYNTIQHNAGAGLYGGSDNVVDSNCITENGQEGFGFYRPKLKHGSAVVNVRLTNNEISRNNTDNIKDCGCTGGGKFWDTMGGVVAGNWVHDNHGPGLWADTDDIGFDFENNYISDNDAEGLFYEISYNAVVRNNTFLRNAQVEGRHHFARGNFPIGAIYLSESGGDARINGGQFATLDISGNYFEDNWSGVVLWENADRFCNSPSNTSSGYCTKGGAASPKTCVKGTISNEPYYSDCRWKTQNVSVQDNEFHFDPANIQGCAGSLSCGQQGLFSNYGTYPKWSPYKGEAVEKAITFHQNDVFANNQYYGPWGFTAYEADRKLTFAEWQADPYNQDSGSVQH